MRRSKIFSVLGLLGFSLIVLHHPASAQELKPTVINGQQRTYTIILENAGKAARTITVHLDDSQQFKASYRRAEGVITDSQSATSRSDKRTMILTGAVSICFTDGEREWLTVTADKATIVGPLNNR